MSKTPQTLDRFPAIDFEVLARVMTQGSISIEFPYKDGAMAQKFQFLRLIQALKVHEPDSARSKAAQLFTIRLKGCIMTINSKETAPETLAMRAALDGTANTAILSTDEDEVEDLAFKQLREQLAAEGKIDAEGYSLDDNGERIAKK